MDLIQSHTERASISALLSPAYLFFIQAAKLKVKHYEVIVAFFLFALLFL